jgi:hypothetical protein
VVRYPQWVSNIAVVPKKENKIRVYVNYMDLNKVCPKDNFPLPHIDVLIDNAAQRTLSLMVSLGTNRSKWPTKILRIQPYLPCGEPFATRLCHLD